MKATKKPGKANALPVRQPDRHCNARLKSRDGYCDHEAGWGTAHFGNGRCKLHGGKSLVGPASPSFKTGRYCKYLPANLIERYKAALSDEALLELRHEIALLDVRIGEVLQTMGREKTGRQWDSVVELVEQRRKLVESERKRLVEMQQMITSEQAMTMLAVVVDTIRRHVTDRTALAAISADLTRLVAAAPRG